MHKLKQLKEELLEELESYAGAGTAKLQKDALYIKALASACDHICCICAMAEDEEGGMDDQSRRMSRRSYAMDDGTGRSYATGGMSRRVVERGRDMSYGNGMNEDASEFDRILANADDHTIKALTQALQMRK